ncbi:MAG: hypothetical protein AB1806_02145 [Acidobacteriota bacterium]
MVAEQSGPAWWDARLVAPPSDVDVARGFLRVLQQRYEPTARTGPREDPLADLKADILIRQLADQAFVLGQDDYARYRREACMRLAALSIGREAREASEALEQVLQDLLDEIVSGGEAASGSASFRMAVGFLPLAGLEVFTLEVPGEDDAYVLVMSEQIPTYVNLLAKACAQLLPIRRSGQDVSIDLDTPAWPTRLGMEAQGVQRFLELMFASFGGTPSDAEQYWPDPDWQAPAEALREAGEAFLLARQFVHVALDHGGSGTVEDVFVRGERLGARRYTREQESDADIEALRLLLRIPRFADHAAITCWGVDVLLASLAMLEALRARDSSDDEGRGIVTPDETWAGERRERLREALEDMGGSRPGLVEVLTALDPVGRALWARLKDLVLQRDS